MLSAAPASWLRVQNLAFTDNQVSAIYDWDSVALVPEPALVGSASVMHPIDGRLERPDPLPTLAQLDGFVADYEAVRGAPFSDHEHEVLAAGQRWIASYGARCQDFDDLLGIFPDVDQSRGWPRILRDFLDRSAPAAAPSPSAAGNPAIRTFPGKICASRETPSTRRTMRVSRAPERPAAFNSHNRWQPFTASPARVKWRRG
jgi:hypothetical protein